jgi:hypothetical protein
MAAESKGSGGLFIGTRDLSSYRGPPQIQSAPWSMADAARVGKMALNRNSVIGDRYNGPSNWGNAPNWTQALRENHISEKYFNGIDNHTVYYYSDTWVLFSKDQRDYWSSQGIDTSMEADLTP